MPRKFNFQGPGLRVTVSKSQFKVLPSQGPVSQGPRSKGSGSGYHVMILGYAIYKG